MHSNNNRLVRILLSIGTNIRVWWKLLVILLVPIIYSPLLIVSSAAPAKAAYGILIVATYWVADVAPLAATALLPIFIFPILKVSTASQVTEKYFSQNSVLFTAGLIIAVSIVKWNLHKRIAYTTLLLFGSKPKRLLLGFMLVTSFLSMWISNTAVTAFMVPIAQAVIVSLKQEIESNDNRNHDKHAITHSVKFNNNEFDEEIKILTTKEKTEIPDEVNSNHSDEESDGERENINKASYNKSFIKFCKGLMLGICYSANIGGTTTLIGTGPNIVFSGYFNSIYPRAPPVDFGRWFIFAFPSALSLILIAWAYLSILFCDDCLIMCRKKCCKRQITELNNQRIKQVIKGHYKQLGRITYPEVCILVLMIILILFWLFRSPQIFPGWGDLFTDNDHPKGYATDTVIAILFAFLLFVLPANFPWKQNKSKSSYERLLDWEAVQTNLPWGVVLLLGSGFAIAFVAEDSGLTACITSQLESLKEIPPFFISFWLIIASTFATELISNISTISILLPILSNLSARIGANPLYLMVPSTIAVSYAFMFPVATAPNAIVYAYGHLKIIDMLLAGLGMNILGILTLTLYTNSIGIPIFNFYQLPDYFNISTTTNSTNLSSSCY